MSKKSNNERWERERSQGLKKYYIRHIRGMLCIFLGIVIGQWAAKRQFNVQFFIVAILVVAIFSLVAWWANK